MFPRVFSAMLAVFMLSAPAWSAPAAQSASKIETAAKQDYTPQQALSYSQAAIGRSIAGYSFTDASGRTVNMSDYLGKPLVVNFIYTSCSDSCPIITQTLATAVDAARDALDHDSFNVITVGFDAAADSSDRMRHFATSNGIDVDGWKFLSGDLITVARFSDALGFVFYRSPKGFDHLSQVTVIDAGGVVYRQIYGNNFDTPLLVEPLKELVFGTAAPFASIADLIKKVRLFCTIYDPAAGRYRFDYSIFIQLIIGSLIVGSMGVFVTREWWRIYKRRRARLRSRPVSRV
jgi:protein SCO1/2